MSGKYKSGGILAVLHSSKESTTTTAEGKEAEEENVLANLFAKNDDRDETEEEENETAEDAQLSKEFESSLVENVKAANDTTEPNKKKKTKMEETPERLERTLFVGNVALTVTKKMLRKIFNKFGELETIRFRSFVGADAKTPRKVALIKKTFHAECKSMNAYIVYKDKDSVGKALQCNGIVLEGLHIRVDRAAPSKGANKSKQCVFVGNLPYNVSDELLHQHFEKCGAIEAVRAVRDKFSGMGKGFGYVTFKTSDAVLFALKLNGSKLDGRDIRVYRATDSAQQQKKTLHGSRHSNENSFCGLKSTTSKKDREFGKRLVQVKQTKSNAMRRLKGKMWDKKKSNKTGKDSNKAKQKKGKGEKAKGRSRGSK